MFKLLESVKLVVAMDLVLPGRGVGDGRESDWFSIFLKSSEFLKTPPSEILP